MMCVSGIMGNVVSCGSYMFSYDISNTYILAALVASSWFSTFAKCAPCLSQKAWALCRLSLIGDSI